jgi:TetR/AcrR family transcriptional regulator
MPARAKLISLRQRQSPRLTPPMRKRGSKLGQVAPHTRRISKAHGYTTTTRDRFLAAATSKFAAKGYDGARIDEIVQRCNINKNLLYYYFGSNERLFIQVREAAYQAIQQRQAAVSLAGLEPAEGMHKLIRELFRDFAEVPEFISLLNSENLHKACHLKKSERVRAMYPPMVHKINELLERGRPSGEFRSDVDADDLYIAIFGLSYHAPANQYRLSVLFDRDFSEPAQLEHHISRIADMVLSYLRCRPFRWRLQIQW